MNKQVTEYKILSDENWIDLEATVKGYLSLGWQPIGGVAIRTFGSIGVTGLLYLQTMVKYEQ